MERRGNYLPKMIRGDILKHIQGCYYYKEGFVYRYAIDAHCLGDKAKRRI
jgi:hypothetical protein